MLIRIMTSLLAFTVFVAIVAGTGLAILVASIPKLADGWRTAASERGEVVYVALGDSAAQGLGASSTQTSYVGRIAAQAERTTGQSVRTINLSRNGATVRDVLRQQIPELERISDNVTPALVTLDIGGNDVVHGLQGDEQFAKDYEKILQALPPGSSVVADVPYFGGRIRADDRVRQANNVITKLAADYAIPVAPLYQTLKPNQTPLIYATDLFHPNDRGYELWHEAYKSDVGAILESWRKDREAGLTTTL